MQARSLFRHIENTYHVQAEYLWQGFPDDAVFRAPNRKWFALYSRRSEKVVQGGEPQTVQERTARRANAVI